jgi:hypothetical protein
MRWHGRTVLVYRATLEAVRVTWRRDRIDLEALEAAAVEALSELARVELRHSIDRFCGERALR